MPPSDTTDSLLELFGYGKQKEPALAIPDLATKYAADQLASDPFNRVAQNLSTAKFQTSNPWSALAMLAGQGLVGGFGQGLANVNTNRNLNDAYKALASQLITGKLPENEDLRPFGNQLAAITAARDMAKAEALDKEQRNRYSDMVTGAVKEPWLPTSEAILKTKKAQELLGELGSVAPQAVSSEQQAAPGTPERLDELTRQFKGDREAALSVFNTEHKGFADESKKGDELQKAKDVINAEFDKVEKLSKLGVANPLSEEFATIGGAEAVNETIIQQVSKGNPSIPERNTIKQAAPSRWDVLLNPERLKAKRAAMMQIIDLGNDGQYWSKTQEQRVAILQGVLKKHGIPLEPTSQGAPTAPSVAASSRRPRMSFEEFKAARAKGLL